jgi:hypothetical protein
MRKDIESSWGGRCSSVYKELGENLPEEFRSANCGRG